MNGFWPQIWRSGRQTQILVFFSFLFHIPTMNCNNSIFSPWPSFQCTSSIPGSSCYAASSLASAWPPFLFSFHTCPVHPMDYLILPPSSDPLITMWSSCLAFASCTISNPYLFIILFLLILPCCLLVYHYSSLACLLIHLLIYLPMPHPLPVYYWLIQTSSSSI